MKTYNELIAEFMGYKTYKHHKDVFVLPVTKAHKSIPLGHPSFPTFDYKNNWNALMGVIEEIEKLKITHETHGKTVPYIEITTYRVSVFYYGGLLNYIYGVKGQPIRVHYNDPKMKKRIKEIGGNYSNSKIEATYKAVVEFIKWHNSNGDTK